ncbi:innexin unc-9-like [Gigantopelta aegis]|uniref:innexin unc-9-like n=1 Tax=Gigantopelta aegis TaxID=1735272 RepID=UPI001B88B903|nr:innexin unc-9-like [Gigantopelta aegis]
MLTLAATASNLPILNIHTSGYDDDVSDRLNHVWSVCILCVFAILISLTEYVGDPIHCWCPAEFTDSHCNYTEAICWIKDTYYIPADDMVPWDPNERNETEVKYYQWVPIILLFLALCFKLPNLFWEALNTKTGFNLKKIIFMAEGAQIGAKCETSVEALATVFDLTLKTSKRSEYGFLHSCIEKVSSLCCFCLGRRTGTYLTGLYLGIKLFYIFMTFALLFLLNKFLAMDYILYGVEVIDHLVNNNELRESPRFPRVTLCDFEIRQMQNIQRFTVQCVLSVNLFNEKVFAFLWFWICFVAIVNIYSYLSWLIKLTFPSNRIKYVYKYLMLVHKGLRKAHAEGKFTRDYLTTDGVFLLMMLEYNVNEMLVMDLVRHLWSKYNETVVV